MVPKNEREPLAHCIRLRSLTKHELTNDRTKRLTIIRASVGLRRV